MVNITLKKIDKHITLSKQNYLFLTDLKTSLFFTGNSSSYSDLINLSIETLKRQLDKTKEDKTEILKKALKEVKEA